MRKGVKRSFKFSRANKKVRGTKEEEEWGKKIAVIEKGSQNISRNAK